MGPEEPPPAPLPRRVPGEADLRAFTVEGVPEGRHRVIFGRLRVLPPQGRSAVPELRVLRPWPEKGRIRPSFWLGGPGRVGTLAVAVLAAALAAGCSSGSAAGEGGQSGQPVVSGAAADLRAMCPATVVIQSSWFSQVEHFAAYQLLGEGYTIDAARKRVTGPLVSAGVDTGVKVEIRAGGPAIGFQQVSAQMYADRSIMLGMVPLDEAIQNSADQPVTGVMAPYDVDPLVLMWDPARYPDFGTIADIGQTDTPVLFFSGERTYMDYLTGSGQLRASQIDGSYDGTPSRLVASQGKVVQQGFATSEPWKWQHEVPKWGKPLAYQLVADTGYPNYRNLFAVRTGDRTQLDGCLRRLVPMLQRATVEFMATPEPTIATILSIIKKAQQGYEDSAARSRHAVAVMRSDGLVTNGTTPMVGDFDLKGRGRVQRLIDINRPIFTAQRKPLKPGLVPADVATNAYLDPAIGLPRSK